MEPEKETELERLIKELGDQHAAAKVPGEPWLTLREILREGYRKGTPVIIISPETGKLSTAMGEFAEFAYRKSGGLGDIAAAQCKGLRERGVDAHFVTLNLSKAFREQSDMSVEDYIKARHSIPDDFIHLVTSPSFEDYSTAYDKDTLKTALELQESSMRIVKRIRAQYNGKGIVIANDWMAEGIFSAYCKLREIPILDVSHNSHTGLIPMQDVYVRDVLRKGMEEHIFKSGDANGNICMDSKATGIKNASIAGFVGRKFLDEILDDYFTNRSFIPESVRREIKIKHGFDQTAVLVNGISPEMYPEEQEENPDYNKPGLAKSFNPSNDFNSIIEAKLLNLGKFQHKTGLQPNNNATLLYWPSRLDNTQKGIELLDKGMLERFLYDYPDVQMAFVGNPADPKDMKTVEMIRQLSMDFGGRVAYSPFNEDLSMLGYAASHIVFGASLYEPFGQIDVIAWLYGALSLNRDTGGYNEKMHELSSAMAENVEEPGKGVLFKDYSVSALDWGLRESVKQHKWLGSNPEIWSQKLTDIITKPRELWSLDRMINEFYMPALNRLNEGRALQS